MCGHRAACSQVSTVLFYARTAKFVQAQICVGDMCVSHLQVKGQQHHLSQNIGPTIAWSARPVPPALLFSQLPDLTNLFGSDVEHSDFMFCGQ